jgi:hypothetical protein
MEARFTNGYSVNRVWSGGTSDETSSELLAAFQYERDAEAFAMMKVAEDSEKDLDLCGYVISDHYSGKISIMRP